MSESGINLQLLTLPDDSPLATASWEERKKALNLNNDGSPKAETRKWLDAVRPNRIIISSLNPVKVDATKAAFRDMISFGFDVVFTSMVGLSHVSDQPKSSAETRLGAENRARGVFDAYTDTLYSVGIEGGIDDGPDGMTSFAWVCVFDGEKTSFAQTAVFYLPHEVAQLVREGKELGEADDIVFSRSNSKQFEGAIGLLTHNSITRMEYYTHAVIMALIPFENKSLTWPSPAPVSKPFLDAQVVAAAETQAVKDAEFAPGTTAMHLDEPVLIIDRSVNGLERQAFFLEDLLRGRQWVSAKDLRLAGDLPDLSEALNELVEIIENAGDTIDDLRKACNAKDTDIKLQSKMIEAKNEDSVRLYNDLQQAKAEASKYRDLLSEMMLDRNRAQLAAVNAMLDKEELQAQAQTLQDGVRKSRKLYGPTDSLIEEMYEQGWQIAFEGYSGTSHMIRFERLEPLPQPELDEDETQASAAAPIPVEEPVSVDVHEIVFGDPVPPVVVGQGSITSRLMAGEPVESIKEDLNRQAITRGLAAIGEKLDLLEDITDPDTPALLLTAGN